MGQSRLRLGGPALTALDFLGAANWPMTTATPDVAAPWITTDQFTWAVNALLDGVTVSS